MSSLYIKNNVDEAAKRILKSHAAYAGSMGEAFNQLIKAGDEVLKQRREADKTGPVAT